MTAAGRPAARPPVALYVHVPFCLSICPYCDFVVYAGRSARGEANRLEAFLDAVVVEVRLRSEAARRGFGAVARLASVYVGGGTPSLLAPRQVERLLASIDGEFGIAQGAEVTMEVNPGSADRGDLAGFRAAGVTRLSIGVQSMAGAELRRLGRRHSADDVRATVGQARRAGFDNLGVDLLYDVPGQTPDSWRETVVAVLRLEPEHASAYALDLSGASGGGEAEHLPASRGALRWRQRARPEQDEDRAAACYELAEELFAGAGLGWYELSNWSRPGSESRHNQAYWRWLPYEAVGPGAHAFDGGLRRRWNTAGLDAYVGALLADEPSLPAGGGETLDEPTAAAERAILALRTREGLPAAQSRLPVFGPALAWGRSAGLLEQAAAADLRLTTRGRLLASEVFWRLLPQPPRTRVAQAGRAPVSADRRMPPRSASPSPACDERPTSRPPVSSRATRSSAS